MYKKGFVALLIIPVLLILVLVAGTLFFLNNKKATNINTSEKNGKTQWKGALLTNNGIRIINSDGTFSKTVYSIPDIKRIEDNTPYTLREDGLLIVRGDPQLSPNFTLNTLYSWQVGSNDGFKTLFSIEDGKKIGAFAFSPDNKYVAMNYVTKTEEEVLQGFDYSQYSTEEVGNALREREKTFQEEKRTITILDMANGKEIKTLKLRPNDSPSRETWVSQLIWNEGGLFAKQIYEITIFDTNTWNEKGRLKNDESLSGPLQPIPVYISPDGGKYYNITTLEARSIPEDDVVGQLKDPQIISLDQVNESTGEEKLVSPGFVAFSNDSKRLVIVGKSLQEKYFVLWELDLETNKTKKIADFYSLDYGSLAERHPLINGKKILPFISFTPSGQQIIFGVYSEQEHTNARLDFFALIPGEEKTSYHQNLPEVTGWPDFSGVQFLGWYQGVN